MFFAIRVQLQSSLNFVALSYILNEMLKIAFRVVLLSFALSPLVQPSSSWKFNWKTFSYRGWAIKITKHKSIFSSCFPQQSSQVSGKVWNLKTSKPKTSYSRPEEGCKCDFKAENYKSLIILHHVCVILLSRLGVFLT
jgi:hypothetical protein